MRRFLTILFTTLLLTAALCVTASASNFDDAAEDLSAIGMFLGTDNGFDLDRAPTRSEAAIMLVRLYGAEDAAKAAYEAGEIKHPFTDVSQFTSPYVAWLYTKGIANGTTATAFGSANKCTAQNYTVFLLRALGYKDGTDFQYADAAGFAMSKGMADLSALTGTFLRDDLAALTYQALACDLADGSTYLLDSLVKSGAVDADDAKPITGKIDAYRALMSATNDTMQNSIDADIDMKMDMDMSYSGSALNNPEVAASLTEAGLADLKASVNVTGNIQMILAEAPRMAMTLKMDMDMMGEKEAAEIGYWLKDGWIYTQETADGETSQAKYQVDLDEFMETYQALMELSTQSGNMMSLPFIDSITTSKSGTNTVYTMKLNSSVNGLFDDLMGAVMATLPQDQVSGFGLSLELKECAYTYTLNSKNELKSCDAVMDMGMSMKVADEDIGDLNMVYGIKADVKMDVNAVGGNVKIKYPSGLSSFPEIAGGNAVPSPAA